MTATCSARRQPAFLARALLLLWSAAILAAIAVAPLAASAARPEGWFLYEAFRPLCHQDPQRSWHLQGFPWAVCARCLGVYSGLLLAAVFGLRLPAKALAVALGLLGASWVAEFTGLGAPSGGIRFGTGLLLGCGIAAVVLSWAPRRRAQPGNAAPPSHPQSET
jgi:uncharacterized membrane protein